ncbi:MAG: glycosyltransferase, partial [Alistipes sp.]|nr:glycosyltransferase [Alistipes sp.]
MKKLLSIIVPTYNMEELLPARLDSLVGSAAAAALDVVVVNDGSRDSSLS